MPRCWGRSDQNLVGGPGFEPGVPRSRTLGRSRSCGCFAVVHYAFSLAFAAGKDTRSQHPCGDGESDGVTDSIANRLLEPVFVRCVGFQNDLQRVERMGLAVDDQDVLAIEARKAGQELLELAWKDVLSAYDQHVIGATLHPQEASIRAATSAGLGGEHGPIPCAVAQHW